jgi:nitrogenase subunit NifH
MLTTNSNQEIQHFSEILASIGKEKSALFNLESNAPVNFALCTHVLPDGIGDLVHLKDFADYIESIPNTHVTRIVFIHEGELKKAASILEAKQSSDHFLIPYTIDKEGSMVLTKDGNNALETLKTSGVLEKSDFRMQISAKLQVSERKTFLEGNGLFTEKDWLSFLEIRPGVYAYQTKTHAPGLIYMGLEKKHKEGGIKLNDTIIQINDKLNNQNVSKEELINQHIKTPIIKKVVSQAISQEYFIAAGYLHTQLTKRAYLTLLSEISDTKNILITSNQLNLETLNKMDLSHLAKKGIGQIVIHNSDDSEVVIKIGNGQRQISVLQMKDCTNDEFNALFAIADATCAAGDTSIGQVMSSTALPFFDVVDNKRYFLDTQLLAFIQGFSDHQPLYDYIHACVNLISDSGINQELLQKMIEISTKQRPALLKQWQQVTAEIHQNFNAYNGLLTFIEDNATHQLFARASHWLSTNPGNQEETIFLQKYQKDFFNYLIYTERTDLFIKLLENKKFAPEVALKIFDEENKNILELILNADNNRLTEAILGNLNPPEQQRFLSKLFLYCAIGDTENTLLTNKYAHLVDCRLLENFTFDINMPLQEEYLTALCKKALAENDTEYFKKLSPEIVYELNKILPAHLVPPEIKEILEAGVNESFEGYASENYDSEYVEEYTSDYYPDDTEEVIYPPKNLDQDITDMKQKTIDTLWDLPINDTDKVVLSSLLDKPIEMIKEEALDWQHGSYYDPDLDNQVAQALMSFVNAMQTQNTPAPPLKTYSNDNHISLTFFGSNHSSSTTKQQNLLEKEKMQQEIQKLPISPGDKELLIKLLDEPKESILEEVEQWNSSEHYI